MDKYGLLFKYQSGFPANFSTDSCLVQLRYFEKNGQMISRWDDPSWPTKNVRHVRSHLTFTKN